MIPQNVLSTTPDPDAFRAPRDRVKERLIDYELGGRAIQDSSEGLELQVWRGRYLDGAIVLDVPGVVEPVTVLEIADVTEFQFTFDQNMQPAIAYVVNDQTAHWYWYDTTVPGFETLDLPEGSITPRCTLDDKRHASGTLTGASDIILTYLR